MKSDEGANAERHVAELILGQIEGADDWSYNVDWQVTEIVIREIKNCEARGPLCHIWDISELVA